MSLSHMVYEVCFIVMVAGFCGHGVHVIDYRQMLTNYF